MQSFTSQAARWFKRLDWFDWLVGLAVSVGAFLRLYNLDRALQFLGDQGRDALVVARMFKELDPVFIGPVTSVGNMYLGPVYYYFMAPFLWMTYPSPLGPQYAVALLSILTIWLVWRLGQKLIGREPAAIATLVYALSHLVVTHSRFSWNPNPVPLVSLLMLYSVFEAQKGKNQYWIWAAVCFAILLQLHYVAGVTALAAGMVWLYRLLTIRVKSKQVISLLVYTALAIGVVAASFVPLILFDYKHGWINMSAFTRLVSSEDNFAHLNDNSILPKIAQALQESHGRSMHILFEPYIGKVRWLNTVLVGLVFVALGWLLSGVRRVKTLRRAPGLPVIIVWLLAGIVGTSLYQHSVFDHYLGFVYPVTAFIYGVVLWFLWSTHSLGKAVTVVFLVGYIWFNMTHMRLKDAGLTIYEMERISETIAERVPSETLYNIVLFSHSHDLYGMNYRYFLDSMTESLVREHNWTEAEILFVIDEERTGRDVLSAPVHEIVTFPTKQPSEVFEVEGVQIIVLER